MEAELPSFPDVDFSDETLSFADAQPSDETVRTDAAAAAASSAFMCQGPGCPATRAGLDTCTPQCTWQCSSPKCDEVCSPKCQAPKCETRCPSTPDLSSCAFDCDTPACSVSCPQNGCSSLDCPSCQASCGEAHCKLNCQGEQACSTVCEQPECEWECKAPEDCPAPECQMVCQQPTDCMGSTHKELPPLLPGECAIQTVKASTALTQMGGNHTGLLSVEARSMPHRHDLHANHVGVPQPKRHTLQFPVMNLARARPL